MHTILTLASFCGGSLPLLARAASELFDPKIEVCSGYPAHCSSWLTVYYHRKSQRWSFEWYEHAACQRPLALPDPAASLMQEVTDKGARPEECSQALKMLERMAFMEA